MRISNECRVTFRYKPDTVSPSIVNTVFSNVVSTDVINELISVTKKVNKDTISKFEVLTYDIVIKNISDIDVTNVFFQDSIPKGLRFISNSVFVNKVNIRCVNPIKGFYIGTILPGDSISISFKVLVNEENEEHIINNSSKAIYDYIYNIEEKPERVEKESNVVSTQIRKDLFKQLEVSNLLSISKCMPSIKDIISVKIKVKIIDTKLVETPITTTSSYDSNDLSNLIIIGAIDYEVIYNYKSGVQSFREQEGFSSFLLVPSGLEYCEDKSVKATIEQSTYKKVDCRRIFVNTSLLIEI
ncbi:conserved repeat domain-containing protein [Clostridium collagenovorans DSM 3089]|uniref:Conserved repeat domain-containing protein n=1 Tax=Clostridium collagenovorans DSM 3089 TaxID=1121306 RepID=A0A1M5X6E8_9CLOT|nr:DUF11 domain-containing protein [Clostridium collagenovorans]SHH95371.1 conserved repeat domain-containing protein [Clostridium collagenovorans DSM 3089]